MKLGIVSDCLHFRNGEGKVVTENHILLRQLEALSSYFSATLICCPFASFDLNKVVSTYNNSSISFIELPEVGGNSLKAKTKLFTALPAWLKAFRKVDKFSDIVYQRFPNNLNLPGFFYFYFRRKKVFATYTGTWAAYPSEPATYSFQRWLLRKHFRGPVWVYMDKQLSGSRILGGISPSYSMAEWKEETVQVQQRIKTLQATGFSTLKLITVGTLIDYKNQLGILEACVVLKKHNIPFQLTIVGDGPMRETLSQFIQDNDLSNHAEIAGKKNNIELRALYRQHDFVVQAPLSEGFGKVPIEGFFHGVIPVINNIAMAKLMTGNNERGFLFDASKPGDLANILMSLLSKSESLPAMIEKGRDYAKSQTLEAWAEDYYLTIIQYFEKA